jgi:AcrR family transcriptional regulator
MPESNLNVRLNESTDTKTDTKFAILEAAERLFAAHGLNGTSLRMITSEAGVNLASVNYHFGSKDGLIRALYSERLTVLNRERIGLLDDAERDAGESGPELQKVVRAFVAPSIRMATRHPDFMLICGRFHSEPSKDLKEFFLSHFQEVVIRYRAALVRALPAVPVDELFWRMQFLVGAMIHTWTNHEDITVLSGGLCRFEETEVIERLVTFATAALAAPPTETA